MRGVQLCSLSVTVCRRGACADLPLAECERIIRCYDVDGNGFIDFHEFCDAVSEAEAGATRVRKRE